ncbi:MAG TPA: TIGR01777 family oxidoreductase [Gemmatimonadales bacterium]|nr:TIGR01777 family oxidoreductase [Gemmatimonadales bacterium]
MNVVISGASGLIGTALAARLKSAGHRVQRLVRRRAATEEISWDPAAGKLDAAPLEGSDAVINLAGENIGVRWTEARKVRIRQSRVQGTTLLSQTLARLVRPPQVLISVSAVGIYGDRGDETLTESSAPGDPGRDFLVAVCREWEAAANPARAAGIRVVHPRIGVVLSPEGGALQKLLLPFRLGVGGKTGSGNQWMSWVALDDVAEALVYLLTAESLEGPVNLTAPVPVTNRDFTRVLGQVLGRPAVLPVPALALRAIFGEMANRTLLSSARVLPERLIRSGYRFAYPELEGALRSMLMPARRTSFPA